MYTCLFTFRISNMNLCTTLTVYVPPPDIIDLIDLMRSCSISKQPQTRKAENETRKTQQKPQKRKAKSKHQKNKKKRNN